MNWNKVLTIFILLFLVINVGVFGYRELRKQRSYTLPGSRIRQLENVMKQKGVTMYAYLPDFYPKAKLELKNSEWKKEEILKTIFAEKEYRSEISYQGALADTYLNEEQTLSFYTGDYSGTLYYKGKNPRYVPDSLTLLAMESKAVLFAKDLAGKNQEFEVTHRQIVDDGYLLEVNGLFRKEHIFSSYFQIRINAEGIQEAIGRFYQPLDFTGQPEEIYAFDEVMYYFMNKMEEKGKSQIIIKDVDVGYWILDTNAKQLAIESIPVYRIILDGDDSIYYIDAYKNEFLD
ncbi:MAG: hypothetical protein Q4A29_06680 [Eubacteriales bacterium]|nr:hypothetical protein [Eubacteriales bacterium]